MVYRPLLGRTGYWLRQFNDTGERTLDKILDTMTTLGGGTCLCMKVAEGLTWQGKNDRAGLTPIFSLEDVVALRDHCHARNVTFLPVVVPRGDDPLGEAAMHGDVAAAIGALMTDIEPYEHYWDHAPLDLIPTYTSALRQAAPDAYLINQPDPRGGNVSAARVEETADDFDAIAGQHYVGWAEVGWLDVNLEVQRFERLAALGRAMYVTLWGTERTDLALAFWERVRSRSLGANIFRFGAMNARELDVFARMGAPAAGQDAIDGAGTGTTLNPLRVDPLAAIAGVEAQLVDAIVSFATDNFLPPDLLLTMGVVESDLNPGAAVENDRERSYGVFQINTNAHGGDRETWIGVEGTRRAMRQMVGRWQRAFAQHGGAGAWRADPEAFLRAFHPDAQGSVGIGQERARTCVTRGKQVFAAWKEATAGGGRLDEPKAGLAATVTAEIRANFRSAPSDSAEILGTVERGARVALRRQAFYPVRWNGQDGWMWGGFLSFVLPDAGGGHPAGAVAVTTTAPRGLNFRARPDDGARILAVAPPGTAVRLRNEAFFPAASAPFGDGWIWGNLLAFQRP